LHKRDNKDEFIMAFSLKRLLVGKPIPTERAHHQRLPKIVALAVFASDALSSTAYATEEIMLALLMAVNYAMMTPGDAASRLATILPIGIGIATLLIVVALSYRQTVYAYPQGGGAYLVAKENFGQRTGLVAAAALLIDYVLTVAVSIAAGVAAISSAFPVLQESTAYIVGLCLGFITLITLLNLRGVKESGIVFAIPTYGFVLSMLTLLGFGFYTHFNGGLAPYAPLEQQKTLSNPEWVRDLSLFMVLRAFASGCTALTGIEAISDGVPAFRPPESRNAAITLGWMATILVSLFLGITTLTFLSGSQPIVAASHGVMHVEHAHLHSTETLISVLARRTFSGGGMAWFYFVVQAMTAAILILAANTAYADFPRLSSVLARDRFMPRQMANIGDRLAFNNGIILLAVASGLIIVFFKGSVTRIISLYALGVFLSFTLSQSGMVMHWRKLRPPGWKLNATINAIGATATCIVMLIILYAKFWGGAWMVVVAIPAIVFTLKKINDHYRSVAKQLSLEGYRPEQGMRHHVFVLVPDIHRGVIPALQYARSISPDARALHVSIDPAREQRLRERWTLYSRGVPLTMLPSPYRSLVNPVVQHLREIQEREPRSRITVVIPEFVPKGWFPKLLHGHASLLLVLRLHEMRGVVVINVPYHIEAFVELEPDEQMPTPSRATPLGH
jgi:amino acid transporter